MTTRETIESTETDWQKRVAWRPTESYFQASRLKAFYESQGINSYAEFVEWSLADVGRYWDAVANDLDLVFHRSYRQPVDLSRGPAWPEWFVGGGFNYATSALDKNIIGGRAEKDALRWEGDDGDTRSWTYSQLQQETNRFANALRRLGLQKGDRVGIYMPMTPETVAAVMACAVTGIIFTPLFSGYAADAIAKRLADCGAKALLTADGYYRRGKHIDMKSIADAAVEQVQTIERIIVLQRCGADVAWNDTRDVWWHEAVEGESEEAAIEPTAANDPYMILYTSGTTGKPKGAVHVHAGFPIKAAHDLAYTFDLHDDDVLFWLTDLGWMMGPWLIAGGLMLGATIVLFEGTPDYPYPDRLWSIAERQEVTVLGVAPTAIRALMPRGDQWVDAHDLSQLRILGSTGEPWNPDPWRWYFEKVGGGKLPIINYSGGTETSGGIVGCLTIQSIKPCAFSGPVPGMDADVVDDCGQPLRGEVGELVIRQPWVGMTRGFWKDDERYEQTYWSRFENIWVHGDWVEVDADGFWYIRGRSDDTLNVAGKRIGPAEIESAAVSHPAVREAAAIGAPHEIKGEAVWVFAVFNEGYVDSAELETELIGHVAGLLGSSFRPAGIKSVSDLPRTRNAKVMRRVVRTAFLGLPVGDITALENPGAVEEIVAIRGARS